MSFIGSMQVRFPETITVKYGPIPLLSRFFLMADQQLRDRGIRVMIRYDMDELLALNRSETAAGRWYPLPGAYNPEVNELTPANSFWMSGINEAGETVVAQAARVYDWRQSNLAEHALDLLYGDLAIRDAQGELRPCLVDCPAAVQTNGMVYFGGATWIRPDHRRLGLGSIMPKLSRAFGLASWGTEWLTALIKRELIELNMHKAYGYSDASFSIKFPASPWGDLDFGLARQHSSELLQKVQEYVSPAAEPASLVQSSKVA